MYCRKCGSEIQDNEKVCLNCGEKNQEFKNKKGIFNFIKRHKVLTAFLIIIIVIIGSIINSINEAKNSDIADFKTITNDYEKNAITSWIETVYKTSGQDIIKDVKNIKVVGGHDGDTVCLSGTLIGSKVNKPSVLLNFKKVANDKVQPITNDSTYDTFVNNINEFIGDNGGDKSKNSARQSQTVSISAKELYDAYEKNEVDADNKYSGKTGIITGKIYSISVSDGKPTIGLVDSKDNYQITIADVTCYFDDSSQSNRIANLKKGQIVTIKGTIRGSGIVGVPIDNCILQ